MRKEYGGYLPFEGHIDKDFFSQYGEEHIVRTNSGKAAIFYAIKMMDISKIYVPFYFCGSVFRMIEKIGITVERFYLRDDLTPDLDEIEESAGIILVNYFGFMNHKIRELVLKYRNIIVDQTHSFFSPPIFREDIYNIYSCRKFIGVPDGGYLVGERIQGVNLENCKVSQHFLYLVQSYEYGTNSAYNEKLESDKYFSENFGGMSNLTRCMLATVDYEYIRKKRVENYKVLNDILGKDNLLNTENLEEPLYLYPFLIKADLKRKLIDEKIYVPTLWKELIVPEFYNTIEYDLSDKTVFLPIDQRYDAEDMVYLGRKVKRYLQDSAI